MSVTNPKLWESFGRDVRLLRTARKMTQAQLAKAIGVDHTYISKIECGHVQPPAMETIRAIEAACGVVPGWLNYLFTFADPAEMTRSQLEAEVRALRTVQARAPRDWQEAS